MGRGKGNCPGGPIRYWYWDNRLFVLKQTNGLQGIKGSTTGMMTVGERTLVSSINNLIIISIDPLTVTSLGRQFKLASRRKKEIRGIDLAAVKSRKFNSAIFGQVPWYLGVESPLPLSSFSSQTETTEISMEISGRKSHSHSRPHRPERKEDERERNDDGRR